jgi:hypothetical protein
MSSGAWLRLRVVDPAGQGVPELLLRVVSDAAEPGRRWTAAVTTAEDGTAEVRVVPLGPAHVRALPGQAWVQPHQSTLLDSTDPAAIFVRPGANDLVLRVVPAAALHARVVDETNGPVAGAVVLHGPRELGWGAAAVTSPDGSCRLGPVEPGAGRIGVVLRPSGVEPRRERWADAVQWVALEPGATTDVVLEVVRSPTAAVACRVVRSDGAPAAGIEVGLAHAEDSPFAARRAVAGADGSARFDRLQPGRYHVVSPRGVAGPLATVDVDDRTVAVEVVVAARRDLAVEVLDAAGAPVVGATLLFQVVPRGEQATGTTDATGRARLSALPEGEAYLAVDASGFVSRIERIRHDGTTHRLALTRSRTLQVRGRVPDGFEGASVRFGLAHGDEAPHVGGEVGAVRDGAFAHTATVAPDGVGHVAVRIGDAVPVLHPFDADTAEIDLGALPLEPGVTLRGSVEDRGWAARGGFTWLEVRTPAHGIFHHHLRTDGTFEVHGVPPGEIELFLSVRDVTAEDARLSATVQRTVRGPVEDLGPVPLRPDPDPT